MDNIIKKDINRILTKVIATIKNRNSSKLINLSNEINHNSSIFQDEDSITIAVVVYSYAKILDRGNRLSLPVPISMFKKAKDFLRTDNFEKYRSTIKDIIKKIQNHDSEMKSYILHVYNRAEIKKGSKLFSNGISLPRVAELMNLSQWELMEYVGKTNLADTFTKDKKIKSRLNYARKLFNVRA